MSTYNPTTAAVRGTTGRGEKLEAGPALGVLPASDLPFAITANRTTQRDRLPLGDTRSVQQDAGNGALN